MWSSVPFASPPIVLLLPSRAWLALGRGFWGQCSLHFGCGVDRRVLLTLTQLKCMQEKKCSQVGKEIPVYDSLLCPSPIWFLVATRAFTGAMHLLSHDCLYSSIVVFLVWSVLEYLSKHREMSWVGGEDALVCSIWGKVTPVERVHGGVAYAGGNRMGLLCCSCLFSSGKWLRPVLANCFFWCKQGSAPGS